MISVPATTAAPIGGRGDFDGPYAPQGEEVPATATGTPAPADAGSDALARYGAEHGLHRQAQQQGTSSPPQAAGATAGAAATSGPTDAQRAQAQKLMDEGVKLLMAKDYEAALERFEAAYQLVPSPKILLNKAAALRDMGRHAEAVVAYEQYLASPGDRPRIDEARRAMEDSRSHLGGRTYTAADIVEAKRLTDEGITAYREGRYQDASNAWGAAYERNPNPKLLQSQATCMQQLGANYSAARLYRAYAEADPKIAAEFNQRADRLLERARSEPITAGGQAGGMEWMARGNELLHAHRYEEAIAAYDEGFRTYPSNAFALNKASALLDSGRHAEADLAYGQYLGNPDAPRADEARTAQLRAREHMGGREATITGVAESHRLIGEGAALYKAGKFADALQAYDRAYALNPLADLRYNQAACIEKMGAFEIAALRYEQYLKEAPGTKDADQVRGHITALHDKAKGASREAFDRAQEAYLARDFKGAAAAFVEAFSHLPRPEYLYNQAAALDMAGDAKGAVKAYQQYLNLAPHAADAGKVRARIEELQHSRGAALEKPVDPVADAKLKLAQRDFDKGKQAYDQGRFGDAARHFADAYAHRPFPQFLYNVGASLHKAGDTWGAVKAYQQYLNAFPDAPDATRVRKAIDLLLERIGAGLEKP